MMTPARMNLAEYRAAVSGKGAVSDKPKQKMNRPEEDLHRSCIAWADNPIIRAKYPLLAYLFHPANGGGRSKAEAGVMKACGVRSGVPDLLLPVRATHSEFKGLAIELKSPVGIASAAQKDWLAIFAQDGYLSVVVRDLNSFIQVVGSFYGESNLLLNRKFEIASEENSPIKKRSPKG